MERRERKERDESETSERVAKDDIKNDIKTNRVFCRFKTIPLGRYFRFEYDAKIYYFRFVFRM